MTGVVYVNVKPFGCEPFRHIYVCYHQSAYQWNQYLPSFHLFLFREPQPGKKCIIELNSLRLMFQWRVFTTVKWNILFPQGVCLALVVPSGSQSWTIITLGKICLSGFGSALRVPKVNTHHPRGKNLWLKSMIPFFETKNVLRALYWGFNKIPVRWIFSLLRKSVHLVFFQVKNKDSLDVILVALWLPRLGTRWRLL